MTKPISPLAHGVVDYTFATTTAALSSRLDASPAARALLGIASGVATAYSVFTRYPLGLSPRLTMAQHLAVDYAVGALMLAAPLVLLHDTARTRGLLAALGATGLVTALLTRAEDQEPLFTSARRREAPVSAESTAIAR
jgi:hypothetical protein